MLDRVQVPKGSFYNYFESKEAFAAAAIRHYADCFAARMRTALQAAPDPYTGLRRFFDGLMIDLEATGFTGGCLIAKQGASLAAASAWRAASLLSAKSTSGTCLFRDGYRLSTSAILGALTAGNPCIGVHVFLRQGDRPAGGRAKRHRD